MEQQIFQKLIAITQEVDAIAKNKSNAQQGYKFRGIDDLYNALHPLFSKHGVFVTSKVLSEKREERQTSKGGNLIWSILDIEFSFFAADGSSVSSVIKGEGMDSGDKASNKAMSSGLKYALMQMFLIPTEDIDDADKSTPAPSKPVQNKLVNAQQVKLTDAQKASIREANPGISRAAVETLLGLFDTNESLSKALEFFKYSVNEIIKAETEGKK